jgi:hypothetical protein
MKKIFILAVSAMLALNMSAQDVKKECEGKKFSREERVEMDIQRLRNELMLSDQQAEKFAAVYREYRAQLDAIFEKGKPAKFEPGKEISDAELDNQAKARFESFKVLSDVQAKFYDRFREDLSARQVEKVMRMEPFGQKHCCAGKCDKKGPHDGQRPDFDKKDAKKAKDKSRK